MENLNSPALVRGPLMAHERPHTPAQCPPGNHNRRQGRECTGPDTVATGWGEDQPLPTPRVVPCSTLARWWLAVRRWWA